MKKTISANINGILFHVEEDGYERLRNYLDSIRRYFGRFPGHSEIVTDIENRIAEIFSGKLSETRQVITLSDVEELIHTMGDVKDFAIIEETEDSAGTTDANGQRPADAAPKTKKRLFRDENHRVLGGVCSGVGHYFSIDPAWIRILLAILVYASYGGIILGYLIAWIAIPGSTSLEEQPSVKKMYRDENSGVIGGVASGLAHFFDIDVVLVRLVLVILGFIGGFGIVLYIILWIALPKATSLTERMSMSGEPVTLSNIEKRIKDGLDDAGRKLKSEETKSRIAAPFRFLGRILEGLGPAVRIFFKLIRIFIGLILLIIGVSVLFALILAAGIVLGWISGNFVGDFAPYFPTDAFRQTFGLTAMIAAALVLTVPLLGLALGGISLIAGRRLFNKYIGISLTVLWLAALLIAGIQVPGTILKFSSRGRYSEDSRFAVTKGTPVIRAKDVGLDSYQFTTIRLHAHDSSDIRIVRRFEAQGISRKEAIENAKGVTHQIQQKDSVITIDTNFGFKAGTPFRAQELRIDVYLPAGKPFLLDEHWIDRSSILEDYGDLDEFETLVFDSTGLRCLTCEGDRRDRRSISRLGATRLSNDLRDFQSVDLSGALDVEIIAAPEFAVATTRSEDAEEDFDIYVEDGTLYVEDTDHNGLGFHLHRSGRIGIRISMPVLKAVEASGAGKIYMDGFESDRMSINLSGAMKANAGIKVRDLQTDITGASQLELIGEGEHLDADLSGASKLKAGDYRVNKAEVNASGASSAYVNARDELKGHSTLSDRIKNRGQAVLND